MQYAPLFCLSDVQTQHFYCKPRTPCIRIVDDLRYLCKSVVCQMRSKLHSIQMKRSVSAVEDVGVAVKLPHRDRVDALRIFEDNFPCAPCLPLSEAVYIPLSSVLVSNRKAVKHKAVSKLLAQLHSAETACICRPYTVVVAVPAFALGDIPCYSFITVSKHSAETDIRPRVRLLIW